MEDDQNDEAAELRQFLRVDCMPNLRNLLQLLEPGDPRYDPAAARREVQALLMRAARTAN